MELVLHSGIFQRAPLLASFFRYICECYFDGQAAQIKEYSIALEALGRPADFDPKKDSIVRVEAHRLRKRLNDYYKGPGANHPVHILIPHGQYIPQFVPVENAPPPPDAETGLEPTYPVPDFSTVQLLDTPVPPLPPAQSEMKFSGTWVTALSVALISAALALVGWRLSHSKAAGAPLRPADEKWLGQVAQPVSPEFRMLAGYHGPPFTDRQGHTWNPDAYYAGGHSTPIPPERFIEGEPAPHLLKAQRSGVFHYDIPVRQGTYELHLYFAEIEYGTGNPRGGGEGSRVFQVSINGTPRINQLDPLAEAGAPNRLHERVFKDISPAADGELHIQLGSPGGEAFLDALEIVPSAPGRIRPIRLVTQESPITDADGRVWSADEYFCGGTLVLRRNSILNPGQSALYEGERYGNFSYRIPLGRASTG